MDDVMGNKLIFNRHQNGDDAFQLLSAIEDLDILYLESLHDDQSKYEQLKCIVENIHKESPENIWPRLNKILRKDFGKYFYKNIIFNKKSNIIIRLQDNVPKERYDIEKKRLEIKKSYKEKKISLSKALEKLTPLYKNLVFLEISREKCVIDGLEKLNQEFKNRKIGLFMGIDHSLSIRYICRAKEIEFSSIEIAKHNYYSENIGNLKINYMRNGVVDDTSLVNFVEKWLED